MNDKEIAEKVAKKLGYHKHKTFGHWVDANNMNIMPRTNSCLEQHIFSWPTAGICIEKARDMGWELIVPWDEELHFARHGTGTTKVFNHIEHDYVKAIIYAFSEIPNE